MREPEEHPEEEKRLSELEETHLVHTPAERRFDTVTAAAQSIFQVPIVLFSLLTKDKQWFKSAEGLAVPETERAISFCGHTILGDDVFIVEDTLHDERFNDNPLVTDDPNIRFYAGSPVLGPHGLPLGTLCLIDHKPRSLDAFQQRQLKGLAGWLSCEVNNCGANAGLLLNAPDSQQAGGNALDPYTKAWNRETGTRLLAHLLESVAECPRIEILAVRIAPADSEWTSMSDDRFQSARATIANLMRRALPDGCVLVSLGDTDFLVLSTSVDAPLARQLAGELSKYLLGNRDTGLGLLLHIIEAHNVPRRGRFATDLMSILQGELEKMREAPYIHSLDVADVIASSGSSGAGNAD